MSPITLIRRPGLREQTRHRRRVLVVGDSSELLQSTSLATKEVYGSGGIVEKNYSPQHKALRRRRYDPKNDKGAFEDATASGFFANLCIIELARVVPDHNVCEDTWYVAN